MESESSKSYSLTQFHLIVAAQDSAEVSQKAFFHWATWAGSSNDTLQ